MEAVLVAVGLFFCSLAAVAIAVAADLAKVGVALVQKADAKAKRDDERAERETGAMAGLLRRAETNDAAVKAMHVEWKTFQANNRR